jgi:hypothetical protein
VSSEGADKQVGDWYFQPAEVEPMDWDPIPDAPPATPAPAEARWLSKEARGTSREEVVNVTMGAGDNSFLAAGTN